MTRRFLSLLIGLIIPYASIMLGIYHFRFSTEFILGFPPLYFWVFLWFFLTTICISTAWFLDKKDYQDE
ncbi:DUF3311 domain-containing protein [Paenalcaligenes suwonensis]|uniref:DUF3311 domain-containing protein n=1 Tax=Paenalcaligenes suwonensis TaxID=1202713 RepID=UPI00140B525F|nr:DUF3311 domain-containing protein [Paenalcaligenes suwonensis]NHC60934.1 DUF3311 domain-containing protein [Paenalcaligenes suwonensis]